MKGKTTNKKSQGSEVGNGLREVNKRQTELDDWAEAK